jgi:hypothetical protein
LRSWIPAPRAAPINVLVGEQRRVVSDAAVGVKLLRKNGRALKRTTQPNQYREVFYLLIDLVLFFD